MHPDRHPDQDAATAEVVSTRQGPVRRIVLSRPQQRNALNGQAKRLLRQHLAAAASDETVRAVVLGGDGPAFCVGQDLGEHAEALASSGAGAFDTVDEDYAPIVRLLVTMPKPVVAAIHGACVGAGLGLALACDLRVVAEDARFATAFTAIGLTCDSGLSRSLVDAVGLSRARDLVLTGRSFTPAQADQWGVALEVTAPADVDRRADELAAGLAGGPTAAYAESKRLLAGASSGDLEAVLRAESDAQHRLGATSDHVQAVQAFLSRTKPVFRGH